MIGKSFRHPETGVIYEVMNIKYNEAADTVVGFRQVLEGQAAIQEDRLMYQVEGVNGIAALVKKYDLYAGLEEKQAWPTNEKEMRELQMKNERWGVWFDKVEGDDAKEVVEFKKRFVMYTPVFEDGSRGALRLKDKRAEELNSYGYEESIVCLPGCLREITLASHHAGLGHQGRNRTATTIALKYYWDGMGEDIKQHVYSCRQCNLRKSSNVGISVLHANKPVAAFENIHIDLIVELPETPRGNKHIYVAKEALTKMIVLQPLKTKTQEEVAMTTVDHVYCKFGMSKRLYSDRGREFTNQLSIAINKLLRQRHQLTTAYHPEANGQAESQNESIKDQITPK